MKREWKKCLAYCSAKCKPEGKREDGDKETEGREPMGLGREAREDKG